MSSSTCATSTSHQCCSSSMLSESDCTSEPPVIESARERPREETREMLGELSPRKDLSPPDSCAESWLGLRATLG
eukprot:CAMPEP_0180055118 /NCGR_PEP_ID=MMETSP0985-20121206/3178_1 /TAXON_ID=483367 /ORGANISM="non described non described, Strain CCMP 2436" /LENGTH=74 /DNA_ID=CAMNT_0021984733 /DNA_START=124 /DNA_END=348 /DNA_ORIENTATION=-